MASTQEYLVSCGTTKTPAHLPVDRTRIPPGPPPSLAPLPDAAAAFRAAVTQPARRRRQSARVTRVVAPCGAPGLRGTAR